MRSRSLLRSILFLLVVPTFGWAQPYAYVSGTAAEEIGVVDLQTNALIGTFAMPGRPTGVSIRSTVPD